MPLDQTALRAFYDRRHPAYEGREGHWRFLEATYAGGREWFGDNIFKYYKEGDTEFALRIERAYRFNHTREVVDLVQKYLFKGEVRRNTEDAPEVVTEFWKNMTLSGLNAEQFMRTVSTGNSIGGRVAIVVDNNFAPHYHIDEKTGESLEIARPLSQAEAAESKSRIYAFMVPTKDVLDYAWDEDGDGGLLWIKLREYIRLDANPLFDSGETVERIRLWTRDEWMLFGEEEIKDGRKKKKMVNLLDSGKHGLGRVPVILADHSIVDDPYKVPGLIDDIAYLDRACANYLSNLDAIIQDQTFSQLAMPAQGLMPGDDAYTKLLELGTKRVFIYDAGSGSTAKPDYISPDPKQASMILTVINKIINEIYHTIGLAGERTKEDNAVGIDNSSGVAKAYDFERVNSLLLSKAHALEKVENEMVELVLAWSNEQRPNEKLVTYPTTFDVMRLADDLVTAEALAKLAAPKEVRRAQMKVLVEKLFPQLKIELRKDLAAGIDKWLNEEPVVQPTAGANPVAAPSRQGSVTKDTPAKD